MKFTDYEGNEVDLPQVVNRTTAQLSAQERSKLTDAIIAQVGALTKASNVQHAQIVALQSEAASDHIRLEEVRKHALLTDRERWITNEVRIDAADRRAAVLNTSFLARLRWLVLGR